MFTEERISFAEAKPLLTACGLYPVERADVRIGLFDAEGELAATGALVGDMIQMLAVHPRYRGEELAAKLVTALLREAFARGIRCVYLIAKPESARQIEELGFYRVAETDTAVLLERGAPGIRAFLKTLEQYRADGRTGCVVMNANPFTKGHRYLIEQACAVCDRVSVLAVEEDRSEFPFETRLRLIREGVSDLPQVTVLPGSRYVISDLTFPAYFVRDTARSAAEGALDAVLFGQYIAPALGVTDRFVGTEPLSASTAIYNDALQRILPRYGVKLHVTQRRTEGDDPVSASTVRRLIAAGERAAVRSLVPESTWTLLNGNWDKAAEYCMK